MTGRRNFRHVLLDHICAVERGIRALFGLCVVLFVLMLVSLTVVASGSATYVIVIVNLVSLVIIGGISGGLLLVCRPD